MKIGSDGMAAETRASGEKGGGLSSGDVSTTSQVDGCPKSSQLS